VAWGVRILSFFLWREYFSWPALHQKVVELQLKMDIPFASRLLCWLVYSFFYVSMMASNWSRLQNNGKWGLLGYTGLLVQVGGLLLETIADMQKNGFKLQHRHSWCNVGVWKWSTHPNYLGEGLFWWGTYLAHGFDSPWHSLLATIGLAFVMTVLKGSTRSLSRKHIEKYSDQPGFYEFHRTHSIWGPKNWWWWLHGMEGLSSAQATVVSLPPDDNITRTATTPEDVAPPIQL
jgi:steroid 5-alpha reductase family enzyme